MVMPTKEELIAVINKKYKSIESILQTIPEGCEDSLRPTLEACVKLFWKEHLGREFVWINKGQEEFNFNEAIKNDKFSSYFSPLMISDMHTIRLLGNQTIHGESKRLTASELNELFERLGRIIKEMEKILGFPILQFVGDAKKQGVSSSQKSKANTPREKVNNPRFGEGEIISIDGDIIKVCFNGFDIKKFPYPNSLNDGTLKIIRQETMPLKLSVESKVEAAGGKICPACQVNIIPDDKDMCDVCFKNRSTLLGAIAKGAVLTNIQLTNFFKCSPQGGMRKSNRTNSLVLIKDRESIYDDSWKEGICYYTGMGLQGDQDFLDRQNRTLYYSRNSTVKVYLFERAFSRYTFIGRVELAAEPYYGTQKDRRGVERRVCIFPLKVVEGEETITK